MGQQDSLRVFVRSLLFTRDEEREVMQELAAVLWRKFDVNMDNQAFCRWAFGVARMEALAFRRDCARDRHVFGEEVLELLGQVVLEESEALEAQRRALDVCLKKLPEGQRQLVQAAYGPPPSTRASKSSTSHARTSSATAIALTCSSLTPVKKRSPTKA